jgi:hypothetical protein
MKKVFFTFLVLCFSCVAGFAQQNQTGTDAPSIKAQTDTKIFSGTVDAVPSANDDQQKVEMFVTDNSGQKMSFWIDRDADVSLFDYVEKGDKVNVEYTTNADGTNTAKSIKKTAE